MIRFIAAIIVLLFALLLIVALIGLTASLWVENIDAIETVFPKLQPKDPMEYRKGYEAGRLYAQKYPMGQLTFPIACANCKNLNSDKCYRCKEERESGFEIKMEVENDDTVREDPATS